MVELSLEGCFQINQANPFSFSFFFVALVVFVFVVVAVVIGISVPEFSVERLVLRTRDYESFLQISLVMGIVVALHCCRGHRKMILVIPALKEIHL